MFDENSKHVCASLAWRSARRCLRQLGAGIAVMDGIPWHVKTTIVLEGESSIRWKVSTCQRGFYVRAIVEETKSDQGLVALRVVYTHGGEDRLVIELEEHEITTLVLRDSSGNVDDADQCLTRDAEAIQRRWRAKIRKYFGT
jgi:hypothetical protein